MVLSWLCKTCWLWSMELLFCYTPAQGFSMWIYKKCFLVNSLPSVDPVFKLSCVSLHNLPVYTMKQRWTLTEITAKLKDPSSLTTLLVLDPTGTIPFPFHDAGWDLGMKLSRSVSVGKCYQPTRLNKFQQLLWAEKEGSYLSCSNLSTLSPNFPSGCLHL